MLNFLLKTRQNDYAVYVWVGKGHRKHARLRPPPRAVASQSFAFRKMAEHPIAHFITPILQALRGFVVTLYTIYYITFNYAQQSNS